MRISSSGRRKGWLAIASREGIVEVARIQPGAGGRPQVQLCESFRKEGGEVESFARLRRQHPTHAHRVTTCLRFGEYQFLQAEPPEVAEAELKEAMRWRIKGLVDFPIETARLDILQIPGASRPGAQNRSVFVACAPDELLRARVQTLQQAKIDVEAIDVVETAQRNLAALFEDGQRAVALLGFSNEGGLLTFTHQGELHAFRRLDIRLDQLIEADDEARQALFERIVLELQRSLDSFEHQHHYVTLARLLVMPLPEAVGLARWLAENLYVPVEPIDLAQVMDFSQVPELRNVARQAQCFHLLGAALREYEARP